MAWTLVFTEPFGYTGGPPFPSGHGWTDQSGIWVANSASFSCPSAAYSTGHLSRPPAEAGADHRIVATLTTSAGSTSALVLVRFDATAHNGYAFTVDSANGLSYYKVTAGGYGSKASSAASPSPTGSTDYILTVSAVGTAITASLATAATPGTPIATMSVTDSSFTAGAPALSPLASPNTVKAVQTYSNSSLSLAVSPTTATTGATGVAFTLTGTGTAWTSGTTATLTGGTGASIVTQSTNASTQVITGTFNAGSAAGTLTFGDSTDAATATVTVSAPAPPGPLAIGALSLTANPGTGSVSITVPAASGGTAPYTYATYRNATTPFTPPGTGTLVGTGSGTVVDSAAGVGPGTVYYRTVATDSAGTPATAPTTQSANAVALAVGLAPAPIKILYTGDSITAGVGSSGMPTRAVNMAALALASAAGQVAVTFSNQGVSSQASGDWIAGGSNMTAAESAAATLGANLIHIMIGTNDAKTAGATSKATYKSNVANQANRWIALGYPLVVLSPAPYIVPGTTGWDEAALVRLKSYRDALTELDNGTTIRCVDLGVFEYFADNPGSLGDGVHPNDTGHAALGKLWAAQIQRARVATAAASGIRRLGLNGGF